MALAPSDTRVPQLYVEPDGEDLVVRFHGWDRLWTLRRETRIRTADLTEVGTVPVAALHPSAWSWRLRGTMNAGVIRAGSFIDTHGRELWDVRATGDALLVELGPDAPYRRMVLQVPAPPRPRGGYSRSCPGSTGRPAPTRQIPRPGRPSATSTGMGGVVDQPVGVRRLELVWLPGPDRLAPAPTLEARAPPATHSRRGTATTRPVRGAAFHPRPLDQPAASGVPQS